MRKSKVVYTPLGNRVLAPTLAPAESDCAGASGPSVRAAGPFPGEGARGGCLSPALGKGSPFSFGHADVLKRES